ncbi:MAG TPA: N-methyl-L-tryptophan oxidase [Steroidobacteraceae bacterium]|nr:N-methyl-L-tryptophan oxidase [Steroidobacteraceae bacterium]
MSSFDVAVIGLGAMGSASIYAAARRGLRVFGVDRYEPGHRRGSSFGESRLIRLAYFESPAYVPLVREAYQLWRDLEAASGEKVLTITGVIEAGAPGAPLVLNSWRSSTEHNLRRERLTAREANARFAAFNLPDNWDVIFQPDAGALLPEKAIGLFVAGAKAHGATVRLNTRVVSVEPVGDRVQIALAGGERIDAGSAVVAAGAWIGDLLPDVAANLRLTRQPLLWFRPRESVLVDPNRMPAFLFQTAADVIYGLPNVCGTGVKVASHLSCGDLSSAEQARAEVSRIEAEYLHGELQRYVPAAAGDLVNTSVCIYTRSPDEHFVVGLHPQAPQIVIASPCSGHGFKFASVMGEILADLAINRKTDRPITAFNVERLLGRPTISK